LSWSDYFAQEIGASLTNLAYGGATSSNSYTQGYTGPNSDIPVPCKIFFSSSNLISQNILLIISLSFSFHSVPLDEMSPSL